MPWQPLPRIAFAVATYPFQASESADLPLELGDELYIIEEGGKNGEWLRGYLIAPPSLLSGLTSVKGQTLEARVFSGIFPKSCVEIREVLGEGQDADSDYDMPYVNGQHAGKNSPLVDDGSPNSLNKLAQRTGKDEKSTKRRKTQQSTSTRLAVPTPRDPSGQKPQAPVPMLKIGDETPTSNSEPLVDEISSCLREWHSTNLHELLLSRQYSQLDKMSALVKRLDLSRRQFLNNVLTSHELQQLRERTIWDLVEGNKLLNGEVIVRDPTDRGRVLTGEDSAVNITKLQSIMSLLADKPLVATENVSLSHLLVDLKAFVGATTEPTTLVFYLALKSPGMTAKALSESYSVTVPTSGTLSGISHRKDMRTLFIDLAATDIGDSAVSDTELFLVIKIQQVQSPVLSRTSEPRSTMASRDEQASKVMGERSANGTSGRTSRRSVMWGKVSQRGHSRGAPLSQMASVAETAEAKDTREGPPGTAGSKLHAETTKSSSVHANVLRTIGVGAVKLNSILKQADEVEQVVGIWSPSLMFADEKQDMGEGWIEVIRDLMDSKSGLYEKSRKAARVQLHLRPFQSSDALELIKSTPTLLSNVVQTSKMGFSGAPTKPRSDIYVTLNELFLPRHALLSRSTGSATPVSSNLAGANLQLTLEVRRASGERIEGAIYSSSCSGRTSSWDSAAVERGEKWNQVIRVVIPPEDVQGAHIVAVVADVPQKPFAICHLPLWDQQAFMRDGHHSPLLYKYDETTSSPKPDALGKGGYLNLPWNSRGKDDTSKDEAVTGPMATLRLETFLCSTVFSQEMALLGLLRWREQQPGDMPGLLRQLVFVPEIEIVKLLSDVFDALFGILVENAGNDELEDLVFGSLVTVLGIVHDRRFNLGPLVDHYAENTFNYPFATPCLVRSFTRLLANPADPETSRKLRATFKVVRHIIKFITHARGQQKAKEAGIGITSTSPGFSRHLRSIFKALDGLMRNTASILVGSQTLAVQHFHTWLPELTGLLTIEEIVHIAIDFMDSCSLVKGKLVLYKLVLVINYARLELFSGKEQKLVLAANTVRWIAPHWGSPEIVTDQWRAQVRLCCSIIASQIDILGPEVPAHIHKIIDSYLALQAEPKRAKHQLSLLFPTTYPFPAKPITGKLVFDEATIELSAVLSAISSLPTGMQLDLAQDEMAILLRDTLQVHLSILQGEAFPASWLSVHIYHHKATMRTLSYLAGILLDSFLPDPDDESVEYNTDLWKLFFTVLLKLVGSDALALETFPEQKRRAVWKIAGDLREHGADLLRRTWEAIGWETTVEERQRYGLSRMGGYQVQYVPGLVGPIVELCLSVHEGLRCVAVEVLQTMIASEWTMSEDLIVIQTEMIDCLDHLFKSKPLTESMLQKLFINELMVLFEPLAATPDDPLYRALESLVSTIDEFLDLLVAVHSTDLTGEASHLVQRLHLMDFLRDMQKEEIFIRYVHQLATVQAGARNFTEAGLALRLHADLYKWDPNTFLPALSEPDFPAQSHFDRKERIHFEMIKQFEEGEAWSSALQAYKHLQVEYENSAFDFVKLARTQRAIATIYETVAKSEKVIPKYFRVAFRGMGFPPNLREKDFIFEGLPDERTSAFADRMQEQHPTAQIVSSSDIDDVEGQFIQISSLSPHRDLQHAVFQRAKVHQNVRDYLLSSHPQQFSTTVRRSIVGPVSEHWADKLVYATAEEFPNILRRSEIVSVDRVRLTPIQTALERIIRKTQEMANVERRVQEGDDEQVSLLIEALTISVNADADSSIVRYRELLPSNVVEEDIDDPDTPRQEAITTNLTPLENALRIALVDHAVMIKRCLAMFTKSSNSRLRQSHADLNQSMLGPQFPDTTAYTDNS